MNETVPVMSAGRMCVGIEIIDDSAPEQDESFTVSFSEVKSDSCAGGGERGSGSDGMMLIPISDENAVITIRDNDVADDDVAGTYMCRRIEIAIGYNNMVNGMKTLGSMFKN